MKTNLSYLFSMVNIDKSIINEMIGIFILQVREISGEMLLAEKKGDIDTLSKLAHKAKSSVAIMGMDDLADHLKEFEILARDNTGTNNFKDYIKHFNNEIEEAVIELEDYLKRNQ